MTELQRTEIRRMQTEGLGPTRIAHALGLSENTVKSYCRRNPLAVVARPVCPQCGGPVAERQRFCGGACRMAWWNAHRAHPDGKKQVRVTCACCGQEFPTYPKPARKYCSRACYLEARYGKAGGHGG